MDVYVAFCFTAHKNVVLFTAKNRTSKCISRIFGRSMGNLLYFKDLNERRVIKHGEICKCCMCFFSFALAFTYTNIILVPVMVMYYIYHLFQIH